MNIDSLGKQRARFEDIVDWLAAEIESMDPLPPAFQLHVARQLATLTKAIGELVAQVQDRWVEHARNTWRRSPNRPHLGRPATAPQRQWNAVAPKPNGKT
jgi:hypothetical protein